MSEEEEVIFNLCPLVFPDEISASIGHYQNTDIIVGMFGKD